MNFRWRWSSLSKIFSSTSHILIVAFLLWFGLSYRNTEMITVSIVLLGAAYGLFRSACPTLIKTYSNYYQYTKCGHSHRWILWLLYYTTKEHPRIILGVMDDLYNKGILQDTKPPVIRSRDNQFYEIVLSKTDAIIKAYRYNRACQISIGENDFSKQTVEQEIFWSLYSFLDKENMISVFFCWLCLYAAVITFYMGLFF